VSARIGVVFRPDFRPDILRETASAAERAGVAELWLWEDCFLQGGIAAAAVALASSESLTVGLGVLPAPLRNVVTAAMEIATLEAMFPGRIRVGIGHGVQDWMRQAGAAVASPLTLMREYVTALRGLLAGSSVSADGRYVRLDQVRLDWAPPQPLPVLIGGTGERRTLRLVAEHGDACNLFDIPDGGQTVRRQLDVLARHCAEVGRPYQDVERTITTALLPDESVQGLVDRCSTLSAIGLQHVVIIARGRALTERDLATMADAAEHLTST